MNKRLVRYDPTSHDAWRQCQQKFYKMNRCGLVPKVDNIYLAFGTAFHTARAMMKQGIDLQPATIAACEYYSKTTCTKKPPRAMQDLVDACFAWHRAYVAIPDRYKPIQSTEGEPCVEKEFFIAPFVSTAETDVALCGKTDELAIDPDNGRIIILDAKTTSNKYYTNYQSSYENSPQMHIYSWAVKQVAQLDYYPDILIDGVFLSKEEKSFVYRAPSPLSVSPLMVERIMDTVRNAATEIARRLDTNTPFDYEFNACTGKYSECEFINVCPHGDAAQTMLIKTMFNVRDYNPATFGE